MKPLVLTVHAATVIRERGLNAEWVDRTARQPEWTAPDPEDETLQRRFRALPEREGRILRAVCRETADAIVVVSCFLDRNARRPV